MKRLITLIIILFCGRIVFAQYDTVYIDKAWKPCAKEDAVSYRYAVPSGDKYIVYQYYLTDRLKLMGNSLEMVSVCSSINPIIGHGPCTYYFENGHKASKGKYDYGKKRGWWIYWNGAGNDSSIVDYRDDENSYYLRIMGKDTIYYNDKWQNCEKKDASYYRYSLIINDKLEVHDMYMNNIPQMTAECSSIVPFIKEGKCTFYNENGTRHSEGNYVNNKSRDLWTWWDDDGRDSTQIIYSFDGTQRTIRRSAQQKKKDEAESNGNQVSFDIDSVPATFKIEATIFNIATGPVYTNVRTALPEAQLYLLTKNRLSCHDWSALFRVIIKDKIGFELAYDIVSWTINSTKIKRDFQDHIPDYTITFPDDNQHTGYSPFKGGYDLKMARVGLSGYFNKYNMKIIPYCSYIFGISGAYPSVDVNFHQSVSNQTFQRTYMFDGIKSRGIKAGAALRWCFPMGKRKYSINRHFRLYTEILTDLEILQNSGLSYYIDKDLAGNETMSNPLPFTH